MGGVLRTDTHTVPVPLPGAPRPPGPGLPRALAVAVGALAVVSSAAYLLSDVLEAVHGGFTNGQLWLTFAAEAALPPVVVGLAAAQRPRFGRLGGASAVAYAVVYAWFTWTVWYALQHHTPDFAALGDDLSPLMTVGGAVMVLAGLGFGWATWRARRFPRWTGPALGLGVVLVAATTAAPDAAQLVAVAVRDLAFAGMGLAIVRAGRPAVRVRRERPPRPADRRA